MSSSLSYTPYEDRTVNASHLSLGSLEQSFHPEISTLPVSSPKHSEILKLDICNKDKNSTLLENTLSIDLTPINNFEKNINNVEQTKHKNIPSISYNKSLSMKHKKSSISDISASSDYSDDSETSTNHDHEQKSLAILEKSLPIIDEEQNQDIQIISLLPPYNSLENIETPITQKISSQLIPTDTTIATRINDIKIPQSAIKNFKEHIEGMKKAQKLEKPGARLTLREQSNVIDSLRKEKWDLQMKVFFLQQYRDRSRDESVEEIIKQNIELATTVRELSKTNKNLKRIIRDMEMHNQENSIDENNEKYETYEKMLGILQNKIKAYEIEVERLHGLSPNNAAKVFDEFIAKDINKAKKQNEELITKSRNLRSNKDQFYQKTQDYNDEKYNIYQLKDSESFNNIYDIKVHNELRDCIAELKFKNQTLKEENKKLNLELENLDVLRENEMIKLEDNYNEELDKLHNLLNELNDENENIKIDKVNILKEINALSQEYATFKTEAGVEIRVREEEMLKMASDIENYEEILKRKNDHINNLYKKIEEANIQINKLIHSHSETVQDLKEKHAHAEAIINNLTQQQEASLKELNYFRENSKNPFEISKLKKKNHILEQKIIQANEEIEYLKGNYHLNKFEYNSDIEIIDEKNDLLLEDRKELKDINNHSLLSKQLANEKVNTFQEAQYDLEKSLNEILGSNSSNINEIIMTIKQLKSDLLTSQEKIEELNSNLIKKDKILRNKEKMLESMIHENQQISEKLNKEISDKKYALRQLSKLTISTESSRSILANRENKIASLEHTKIKDSKILTALKNQYNNQLSERNNLLMVFWKRLSALLNSEWIHNIQLSNMDASNNFSYFSKNSTLCIKHIEKLVHDFPIKCKELEHKLLKEYQIIVTTLENRTKRISHLENSLKEGISNQAILKKQIVDLKLENHEIKSELRENMKNRQTMQSSISSRETINSAKLDLSKKTLDSIKDKKWILRLKELENRLKAEKEARIRDQKGAQERLADFLHENKELREELQMEKDILHSKAPSELSTHELE
ncbi:hypothetical protein PNEG_00239 [Pneumocystis murina B123]|uniref:Centrosomin N-terminal motif 1 domain-containing protein n=1 Tax=Pneumocystis murina (strain B123) TaxID=1069680 RepID=M7NST8_PNEMU|nr:hypothetical protein PNEG_00239 [Pneumocystis murina B123]EMR11813.1 hypothetical protein PNEG_00239 [Pneumocystis murina B123]